MYLGIHKNDLQFLSTDINPTKQTEVALKGSYSYHTVLKKWWVDKWWVDDYPNVADGGII